MEMGASGN